MKHRQGYKGYVIEARAHELRDGGFSSEFSVEEHDARGVTELSPDAVLRAEYLYDTGVSDRGSDSGWTAED